jgi:hypothetical protein
VVEVPPEFRGTTTQLAGFWPFAAGAESPTIGVPLGPNLLTGVTVCADPISWFERARLISNPSAFVLGRPGLGKSTVVRRIVLGMAAQGVTPLILGDTKPDYTDLVGALGGSVVAFGRGGNVINVLDPGGIAATAARLTGTAAARLRADAHRRRHEMVLALIALGRGTQPAEVERTAIAAALTVLADTHRGARPPVLSDLLGLLAHPTELMCTKVMAPDPAGFVDLLRPLLQSLHHLIDSPLGGVLDGQTSTPMDLDGPGLAIDLSAIPPGDSVLEAAVALACWAEGFGAVDAANALTDAGLAPQRRFLLVLDELWRALRATAGMVDRLDALTRLNRSQGVGQIMITHSLKDLEALPNPDDVAKARGFVERAGMVILGGVPRTEIPAVAGVVPLTGVEQDMLTSWATPASLSPAATPPGLGMFLIKVGPRAGVPVAVRLTAAETHTDLHNTNRRWDL